MVQECLRPAGLERHQGRRPDTVRGRNVLHAVARVARGRCHQGRGADPRRAGTLRLRRSARRRRLLFHVPQLQQAQRHGQSQERQGTRPAARTDREGRHLHREFRSRRHRPAGLRLRRRAENESVDYLRADQGIRAGKPLWQVSFLRHDRAGRRRVSRHHGRGNRAADQAGRHAGRHRHRPSLRHRHPGGAVPAQDHRQGPTHRGRDAGGGHQLQPHRVRPPGPEERAGSARGQPEHPRRDGAERALSMQGRRAQRLLLRLHVALAGQFPVVQADEHHRPHRSHWRSQVRTRPRRAGPTAKPSTRSFPSGP